MAASTNADKKMIKVVLLDIGESASIPPWEHPRLSCIILPCSSCKCRDLLGKGRVGAKKREVLQVGLRKNHVGGRDERAMSENCDYDVI